MFFSYLIARKVTSSIFDPIAYCLFMSGFANAIPLLLYFTNNCSIEYFIFFVCSELLFWIGFIIIYRKKCRFKKHSIHYKDSGWSSFLFRFCTVIYFGTELYIYSTKGIPLLMDNRNDLFKDSGGLGVLIYIKQFPYFYLLLYSFHHLIFYKRRDFIFILVLLVLFTLLGGGKSGIIHFLFAFFVYSYFFLGKKIHVKFKYVFLIILFPVIVIFVKAGGLGASLLSFGERFISNGDCYFMAFPEKDIDRVKIESPLLYTLSPVLRPSRIVSYSTDESTPIGNHLVYLTFPDAEKNGLTTAPNTRLPLAAWACYKWGGLIYTFILGLLVSWTMSKSRKWFYRDIYGLTMFFLLYETGISGITDVLMFFSSLFSFIFSLIFYEALYMCYSIFHHKNNFKSTFCVKVNKNIL